MKGAAYVHMESPFALNNCEQSLRPEKYFVEEGNDGHPHNGCYINAGHWRDQLTRSLENRLRWPRGDVPRRLIQVIYARQEGREKQVRN